MKKQLSGILGFLTAFMLMSSSANAVPQAQLALPRGGTVRSLGTKVDPATHRSVQGYAIVHYKQVKEKEGQAAAVGSKGGRTQCYGYFASDAKWKGSEPWVVNNANIAGLDGNYVLNTLTNGVNKWEDAADGKMGNNTGVNIFGNGTATTDSLSADSSSPDGLNEVVFAPITDDPNTIAVTIVWGIFSGPMTQRQIVEWDQVYDDVDYSWSASGEAGKMDFDNIATHELGHSIGLADMYNSACLEETMFGYASYGETKKRTLNTSDIAGTNKLY